MMPSAGEKSNLPSSGATSSHERLAMTVFKFRIASLDQSGWSYDRLEGLELCSSPQGMTRGWPSTRSWVAEPTRRRCGIPASRPRAGSRARVAPAAARETRMDSKPRRWRKNRP